MKKKNLFRKIYRLGAWCALSGVLVLSACTDEAATGLPAEGAAICFDVGLSEMWESGGSAPAEVPEAERADTLTTRGAEVYILRGPTAADTLFLHATVVDSIAPEEKTDQPQTRSQSVETGSFYDSFGAFAYVYPDTWTDALTPNYMYNVEVTKASNWTARGYDWPGEEQNIRFFAYAPYNAEGVELSAQQDAGAPTITYTTPTDVKNQTDLLVAAPDAMVGTPNKTAPLTFKHALTAVKFAVGDKMLAGRITKITFKNVYSRAVYDMGKKEWSGLKTKTKFEQTFKDKEVDGTPDAEITTEEETFMMIPQTLETASIEVEYTDNLSSTKRTLKTPTLKTVWPVGGTVTYRISTTNIATSTIEVTPSLKFTYKGGTKTCTVTSTANFTRPAPRPDLRVPLTWTAEFVEDDGAGGYRVIDRPDWISTFTPDPENKTITVEVAPQTAVRTHNEILREAMPVGSSADPYDLSTNGGTTNKYTANCYVINAPGYYSLPLVYGNAIKNGSTNSSAYSGSGFINHIGNTISNPYIYNNTDCTPNDAILVWQDRKGLVTNVRLSPDQHSLIFEVPEGNIGQGNAVVAVRSEKGDIMWSWHIWVTDYKLGDDLETVTAKSLSNTKDFSMLPINLGWCYPDDTKFYEGRSAKVRFTQAETKAEQIIEITQRPWSDHTGGNATYYQWGRKDPVLPWCGGSEPDVITDMDAISEGEAGSPAYTNKTWYDASGNAHAASTKFDSGEAQQEGVTIANGWSDNNGNEIITKGILYPGTFCGSIGMDRRYFNLWSARISDSHESPSNPVQTSIKTVYDPCPVGYQVPLRFALQFFKSDDNKILGSWDSNERGWYFDCHDEGTVFFPASGWRYAYYNYGAKLCWVGNAGIYWSATPDGDLSGCSLDTYSVVGGMAEDRIKLTVNNGDPLRVQGCLVRPFKE